MIIMIIIRLRQGGEVRNPGLDRGVRVRAASSAQTTRQSLAPRWALAKTVRRPDVLVANADVKVALAKEQLR